jgi:CRP/FNR family cyclic AMP-dependent transcriptional regulator
VFNRFLVRSLNERLGQFIALLEYGRMLDATARLARSIASLFNPILYPDVTPHLEITQEEIGAISGISRQNANRCLRTLEQEGLLRLEYRSSISNGCAVMVSDGKAGGYWLPR